MYRSGDVVIVVVPAWTGREAQLLRRVSRMSVLAFAEHLGVAPRTVSDWEAGRTRIVPTLGLQAVLDMALSRAEDEVKIRFVALAGDAAVVADSAASEGNGDAAQRRAAIKALGLAGLGATVLPLEAIERITGHGDRPVDAGLIAAHEDLADVLAGLHRVTLPDVLLGQVTQHADRLYGLLDRAMGVEIRRRLEIVATESHVQAGMLAFVAGQWATARRYWALARDVAGDSRDDALCAVAWGASSVVHSSIPTGGVGGDTERAVELLRVAAGHAQRADAKTRAWVHRCLSTELAVSGDERGFHHHMELGERSGAGRDRGYFARSLGQETDTARIRGVGLVLLGRATAAIEVLGASIITGWPRQAAMMLADTAAARILQGEPEEAATGLRRALDVALDCNHASGIRRILGVRARFDLDPYMAALPCVTELDDHLRLTLHPTRPQLGTGPQH